MVEKGVTLNGGLEIWTMKGKGEKGNSKAM